MELTTENLRAYRDTDYKVLARGRHAEIVFRVGEASPHLDALLSDLPAQTAGFITAWNPLSDPKSVNVNRSAQARLKRSIADLGLSYRFGVGEGTDIVRGMLWHEPSLLVLDITIDRLIGLATEYRQHASVWIERGRPPELLVTPFLSEAALRQPSAPRPPPSPPGCAPAGPP